MRYSHIIKCKKPKYLVILVVLLSIQIFPIDGQALVKQDSSFQDALLAPFLPGYLQIINGQQEGFYYLLGIPFMLGGGYLLIDYAFAQDKQARNWELQAGMACQSIYFALDAYSLWAWFRDYSDSYIPTEIRRGREPFLELLGAPFSTSSLIDYRVLPVLGLSLLSTINFEGIGAIGNFFSKSSVSWFGLDVNPWVGLGLQIMYSAVTSAFVAIGEETLFRGVLLETTGIWISSAIFSLLHLGNLLFQENDERSIFRVIKQSIFAFVFGVYAGYITEQDGYSFKKAIAYHYWNNVIASTLLYLNDEGEKSIASTQTSSAKTAYLYFFPTVFYNPSGLYIGFKLSF